MEEELLRCDGCGDELSTDSYNVWKGEVFEPYGIERDYKYILCNECDKLAVDRLLDTGEINEYMAEHWDTDNRFENYEPDLEYIAKYNAKYGKGDRK